MQHFSEAAALGHVPGLGAPHAHVKNAIGCSNEPVKVSQHPLGIVSLAVVAQGIVRAGTSGDGVAKIKPS